MSRNDYIYSNQIISMINKYNKRQILLNNRNDTLRCYIFKELKTSESKIAKQSGISRDLLSRLFHKETYRPSKKTVIKLLPTLLNYRVTYNTKFNLIRLLKMLKQDVNNYDLESIYKDLNLK